MLILCSVTVELRYGTDVCACVSASPRLIENTREREDVVNTSVHSSSHVPCDSLKRRQLVPESHDKHKTWRPGATNGRMWRPRTAADWSSADVVQHARSRHFHSSNSNVRQLTNERQSVMDAGWMMPARGGHVTATRPQQQQQRPSEYWQHSAVADQCTRLVPPTHHVDSHSRWQSSHSSWPQTDQHWNCTGPVSGELYCSDQISSDQSDRTSQWMPATSQSHRRRHWHRHRHGRSKSRQH